MKTVLFVLSLPLLAIVGAMIGVAMFSVDPANSAFMEKIHDDQQHEEVVRALNHVRK